MTKLLILGGTTEARLLCEAVAKLNIDATVSLAGVTTTPEAMALPLRTGGFGGPSGLTRWMEEHDTQALIDATHPFAAQMPWHAFAASEEISVPRLRMLRPPFQTHDDVKRVANLKDALAKIPPDRRILLTTGRRDLDVLAERPDLTVLLRTIEPMDDLPTNATALLMRPPFAVAEEIELLTHHRIDSVIAKDSGGATASKLTAAHKLGREVVLIDRPEQPPGPLVQRVGEAVAWLTHVVGF